MDTVTPVLEAHHGRPAPDDESGRPAGCDLSGAPIDGSAKVVSGAGPTDAYWSPSPVLGYRVWRVHTRALTGARMAWRTPAMTAACLTTGATAGVPHTRGECGAPGCGIYARRSLTGIRGLRAVIGAPGTVAGLVEMTGRVVEHEHGFRAEHVRVVAAGAMWGDRLVVGRAPGYLAALFADPIATLAMGASERALAEPIAGAGRAASLAVLADRLEAIGAEHSASGR